ncbi:MAG: DUF2017 family protein [Verrucomicrobiota bacterium]
MQVNKQLDHLEIILFEPEVLLLRQALQQISANYKVSPDDLPDEVKELWYATNQASSDDLPEDDIEFVHEQLAEFKGENAKLAESILEILSQRMEMPIVVTLSLRDADNFLTIVNDQRLYLAAVNGIGEYEMSESWEELPPSPKKMAVMHIHFLAWMVELLVSNLGDSPRG